MTELDLLDRSPADIDAPYPRFMDRPTSDAEWTERILTNIANPSMFGATPDTDPMAGELARLRAVDPPARSLGDEMVLLAAGLASAGALPIGIRAMGAGTAVFRGQTAEAEQVLNGLALSFRHRLGRNPDALELLRVLGIAPDVGINRAHGLGNVFRGRSPAQINRMFVQKRFATRGENPSEGIGGYVNPRNNRSYHIEPDSSVYREGIEYPHVDVNRLRHTLGAARLSKRKFPLGDKLYGKPKTSYIRDRG